MALVCVVDLHPENRSKDNVKIDTIRAGDPRGLELETANLVRDSRNAR